MGFINKFSFHSEIKASQIPSEPKQLLHTLQDHFNSILVWKLTHNKITLIY